MAREEYHDTVEPGDSGPEVLKDTSPFCMTIMGFTGTDNRVRSMGGMLSAPDMYGEGNVKVWDSYLSWDEKDPK